MYVFAFWCNIASNLIAILSQRAEANIPGIITGRLVCLHRLAGSGVQPNQTTKGSKLPCHVFGIQHLFYSSFFQTPIDAYLFIIKYLLIVREQITPFHIETSIKEVYLDFTKTKCNQFLKCAFIIISIHSVPCLQPLSSSSYRSDPTCLRWLPTMHF